VLKKINKFMFKKLLVAIALLSGVAVSSHAQNFTILASPIDSTVHAADSDYQMYDILTNSSTTDSLALTWQVISYSFPDNNTWKLTGMCDNNVCWGDTGTLNGSITRTAYKIGPGKTCPFTAHFIVPATAGVGTVKLKINSLGQIDTLVWVLNSVPNQTGVSIIKMNDNHVTIYPNPSANANSVFVYADKSLKATNVSVVNIVGQTVKTGSLSSTSEVTELSTSDLSKGSYFIKLIDSKGQTITTRKFIKG
jgi:hypothetical protein